MGCMLTGWDNEGPQLYYLDNDGTRIKGNIFSCGSGSTYAYGVLDTYYKHELTLDEAVELGMNLIKKIHLNLHVFINPLIKDNKNVHLLNN